MMVHMREYSFTLTNPSGSEQLCRIGQFPDSRHAFRLAELIASESGIDESEKLSRWMLEVRDCKGLLVFSAPLGPGGALHTKDHFRQLELCR
jgi:hypothetical protein